MPFYRDILGLELQGVEVIENKRERNPFKWVRSGLTLPFVITMIEFDGQTCIRQFTGARYEQIRRSTGELLCPPGNAGR